MALKIKNSAGNQEIITLYATTAEMNGTGISTSHWLPVSKSGVTYYAGLIPESLSTPPEVVAMKSSLKVSVGGVTYAVAFASKQATATTTGAVIPSTADNRGFLLSYSVYSSTGGGASGAQGGGGNSARWAPYPWITASASGGGGAAGGEPTINGGGISIGVSLVLSSTDVAKWIGSTVTLTIGAAGSAVVGQYVVNKSDSYTSLGSYPNYGRNGSNSTVGNTGGTTSLTTSPGNYSISVPGGPGASIVSFTATGGDGGFAAYGGADAQGGSGGSGAPGSSYATGGDYAYGYGAGYGYTPLVARTSNGKGGVKQSGGRGGNGGDGGWVAYGGGAYSGDTGGGGLAGLVGTCTYSATYWVKGDY